ncbi:MAG TPA: DUF871 domain-containing protein [Clostridiaceae bacterium]|nr:DUF871 domain-containing protein [Clostridiaceae bacterium]HBF76590.1 DUF871 domain-containing protein [Clostridiaceae bacterium]HBG39431.1 DUF871 domain-containing protein [Clostridiaceae bacterium]HBN29146.1 DUF871 domain-containing protein [Clostridiaceae bacterium]HBX49284.1 DUF871 domain-containing protein [Clostridiaceae bacterium]
MHRMGISVYPEHSTEEKDYAYMKLAAKYGFTRIFTCLLSVNEPKEIIMKKFTKFMNQAHELGFIVGVDTNPDVFRHLGASPLNLKPFADMKVDIIRLDGHFSDMEDIAITHNPYEIPIEFNASSNTALDLMIERGANKQNMIVCHNFYPEKYTGLGWNKFMEFTNKYKALGLPVAAFVSSNNENTFGPWPVYEGLPTCEMHRGLPIDLQVRHLLATNSIDDILIGNAFASEDELRAVSQVDKTKITFKLNLSDDVTDEEKNIIYNYPHFGRGDASDYMVRSSVPRSDYQNKTIPYRKCDKKFFHKGDVVIVNDNLSHYRGELQIVTMDIPNSGERNFVGRIEEQELILLELLKPEYLFGFIK